jgi:hypothetical protein
MSVSVHLSKNSLHPGDKQSITVKASDKNSTRAIAGAAVSGKMTGPSGPFKKLQGKTDDEGRVYYSWTVKDTDQTGRYKVTIVVSAPGYDTYSGTKAFRVSPVPVVTPYDQSDSGDNNNPPPFVIPSNPDNANTNSNTNTNTNTDTPTNNNNNHHKNHQDSHPSVPDNTNTDTNNNNPPPFVIPSNAAPNILPNNNPIPSNAPVTIPNNNPIPSNAPVTIPNNNPIPSNAPVTIPNNNPIPSSSGDKIPFLLPFH